MSSFLQKAGCPRTPLSSEGLSGVLGQTGPAPEAVRQMLSCGYNIDGTQICTASEDRWLGAEVKPSDVKAGSFLRSN